MDQRILDLERTVEELSEEVRYLRGEVARLRRLVPGGASGNTPLGSPIGGRDFGGEAAVDASQSDGSFSVVSRAERSFNEAASRSRSGNVSPAVSVGSIGSSASRCTLSWEEREAICDEIGAFVLRGLRGEYRGSSGRDQISLPSGLWLVFRDHFGEVLNSVVVCRTFGECRRLTKVGDQLGDSLFVGLPSEREARLVCSRAGVPWPTSR